MKSRPVVFGPEGNLVGIISVPDAPVSDDVGFILFNSGVLPRIGPHRLNVRLAQRLVDEGQTSFRFDLAGQGDSRAASGALDYMSQSAADLRSAMDLLESAHGIRRFALIGVCSGALSSYQVALDDPRVVGLLMFDGYWYRTAWTRPVEYWKRFRAASWPEIIARIRERLSGSTRRPASQAAPGLFDAAEGSANPPKQQFADGMQRLVDRGVAVCLVYSGSILDYYSYGAQLRHAFPGYDFVSRVRCDYRPDIDHVFLLGETQSRMAALVASWIPEVLAAGRVRT